MAPDGVEPRLIAFIDAPSRAVDDTTWFSFDMFEFDTASAGSCPTRCRSSATSPRS